MNDEVTPDGYRIVRLPEAEQIKGVQCGKCHARFDNKAYGYACGNQPCPVFPQGGVDLLAAWKRMDVPT